MRLFNRKVNWTMGYRRDSDIVFVHGDFNVRNGKIPKKDFQRNISELFSNKTKGIAWFVSHCGTVSKREKYVALMRKFLDIDQVWKL